MLEAVVGQPIPLSLVLSDGATDRFPRASVTDTTTSVVTQVNLTHVAQGAYRATWTPPAPGYAVVVYSVFLDAARTSPDATYEVSSETVLTRKVEQDAAFARILGHLGENVRDDVVAYDLANRPLTFRRRLFATRAAALASTPGGTGEGEVFTVLGSAEHFDAARWETLVRTIQP